MSYRHIPCILLILVGLPGLLLARVPDHVSNLSGCFHVTYRFVEDGKHDLDLKQLNDRPIVEWISLKGDALSEEPHRLQHWGVYFDADLNKYVAQKHWAEEWVTTAEGQWKQVVYSPFGSVRYVCQGTPRMNQLRCLSPNSPKPQRDIKRTDYDLLDRENTLQFTPQGWVQSENNVKKTKAGVVVAVEVGWNDYVRVADDECRAAIDAEANGG